MNFCMETSIGFRHRLQYIRLFRAISIRYSVNGSKEHRLGKLLCSPVDVILCIGDAREVVQPDLVYVASERREIVKLHGIEGPPDLVVEILSPGTRDRDRGYKLKMYARYQVREYWIVDPETRSAALYAFGTQENVEPKFYTATDVMTSAWFPGLAIPLAEVFAD